MTPDDLIEAESRMYDAGYTAGIAEVQSKHMEFRRTYIEGLHRLIDRAMIRHEFESVVYARQLLRSLK